MLAVMLAISIRLQELVPAFSELLHVFRFGERKVLGVNHIQRARPCSAGPQVEQTRMTSLAPSHLVP